MSNSHLVHLLSFTEKLQAGAKSYEGPAFNYVLSTYTQAAKEVLADMHRMGLGTHGSYAEAQRLYTELIIEVASIVPTEEREECMMKIHGFNYLIWQLGRVAIQIS